MTADWHPDPTGRHESRWWDGRAWTDHVSDRGTPGTDPVGWPPAPAAAGLGLASGSLWFQRGDGRIPWALVDPEGAVVGWVVPPTGLIVGPQSAPLLDAAHRPVLAVGQSGGTARVSVGGVEVARVRATGVGRLSRVAYAIEVAGTARLRLETDLEQLHTTPAAIVDRGGSAVATLFARWNADGQVDLHLARLTTFPSDLDAALLALPVAICFDLEGRAAFAAGDREAGSGPAGRWWPGL